ncbi:tyrosine-type recombinase/integrase [Massilimaliae timonensis]|uniref:Tyrosine-type recombinase/integrase n=1 Tax=Massiliimalia timonensis TaxID=1987501 RepID=A0A8J6TZJ5_9FIRM|nr:tyrosine-type recombinase/integrase [Massiliimalia timonensis]MBC8611367.1 tyrosine-type recombinase/integrase [Massiliimalia timonensis]
MASIRKRKTKNGFSYMVVYDYVDENGERIQKSAGTFTDKTKARKVIADIELKMLKNQFVIPSGKTIEEYFENWIPVRARTKGWAYSRLQSAASLLKAHIYPEIGNLPLQKVTPFVIEQLFIGLRTKKSDKTGDYLSGSTLGGIYELLKPGFQDAVRTRQLEENPVQIAKPERDTEETAFWTLEMLTIALDNIQDKLLHLLVHTAATSTSREGETTAFTWDCINWEKGTVKVDKTLQRVAREAIELLSDRDIIRVFPSKVKNSKSILVLKKVKTKKSKREIYITPNLLKELRYRQQQVAKNRAYYGEEYHDYDLVFCLDNGDPIEPKLCEKWFVRWQAQSGLDLPNITFHGLRHTGTTILYRLSRGDVKTVQGFTGHASAKVLMDTYNHTLADSEKGLAKKLADSLYMDSEQETKENQFDDLLESIKKDPLLKQRILNALNTH